MRLVQQGSGVQHAWAANVPARLVVFSAFDCLDECCKQLFTLAADQLTSADTADVLRRCFLLNMIENTFITQSNSSEEVLAAKKKLPSS